MCEKKFNVKQLEYIKKFSCDSSKCVLNCCFIYTIKIDKYSIERYKEQAPELLEYIVQPEEDKFIIPSNDRGCILLEDGLCKIHSKYGTSLLPNVCYTYPRTYYKLRQDIYITSNLLCNHLNNIILDHNNTFNWISSKVDRIPDSLEDSLSNRFEDFNTEELILISKNIIKIVDDTDFNSEETLIRLILLARLFDEVNENYWPLVVNRYINIVNKKKVLCKYNDIKNFKQAIKRELTDSLIHIFLSVNKNYCNKQLEEYIKSVIKCLEDNSSEQLNKKRIDLYQNSNLDSILKKYLKAKLSEIIFPLCNWRNCLDDISIITATYVMLRLIILASEKSHNELIDNEFWAKLIATVEFIPYLKRINFYKALNNFGIVNSNELIRLLVDI